MTQMSRRTFIATGSAAAAAVPLIGATAPATAQAPSRGSGAGSRSSHPGSANTQRRYLFADDHYVESSANIARTVHPGQGVISPLTGTRTIMSYGTTPWEPTRVQLYGSVIYDDSDHVFKMWYRTVLPSGATRICYAESHDGFRWAKPTLGIEAFNGSTRNNISISMDMASVIRDPRDPDPQRRYKMFGWRTGGYTVAFSPDGKHWHGEQVVLPDSDTCSACWDPISERFLATTKHPNPRGRAAYLSTSSDFVNWTQPTVMMTGDDRGDYLAKASTLVTNVAAADEQIYVCPIIPYQDIYVAMPWSFEYTGGNGPGGNADGMVRPQAAFSRDLVNWDRTDRTFLIDHGPAGAFDSGIIQGTTNDIIVKDDKIWLYYSGFNTTHGGDLASKRVSIGLVQWRLDGFASTTNGGDVPGVVVTKPLTVSGRSLHVNVDATSRIGSHGELRVEVLNASGNPISELSGTNAATVRGDQIDGTVTWPGHRDLARLQGQQIKLRFTLRGCDLYSVHFDR